MRLKKLQVKNYRGLKGDNNIIEFDGVDIIFLIGQNNNGKSTFLQAYNMFVTAKKKATIDDFFNKDETIPIEIYGEFIVEDNDKEDKSLSNSDPNWINKWVDENQCVKIKKVWSEPLKEGSKMTYDPTKCEFVDGGFGGFDTILQKYTPTPIFINAISSPEELEAKINEIITKNHIKKLEEEHKEKYDKIIEDLTSLKDEITNSDDINKINEKMNDIFTKVFPELAIEVYPVPDSGIDITKTLKSTHGFKIIDNKLHLEDSDLKRNGNGVIRQAFFSFLSTNNIENGKNKKDYLILFEEPELYLHPEAIFALRDQLYSLVKNSPYQILCATHSPLMIDTSKPHASLVRLVKDSDANTKTFQVKFDLFGGDDEKNYLQMINRFNPHICEAFYSDEVVLVEGDTEAVIYRELISRYYADKRKIFILNTGSKANMVFYQKILTHFGIKHVVVHDVDYETYEDRNGITKPNAMWEVNNKIWDQIQKSNEQYPNIARRYVHFRNFEDAHNYHYTHSIGKPLSAYNFAKTITLESHAKCIEFLNDLFGADKINHTPEDIQTFIENEKNIKG